MPRKFNPDNCNSRVRAHVSFCGMAITLIGKHAFEWSVCIDNGSKIVIKQYPNRVEATREFKRLKSLYKGYGEKSNNRRG